MRIEKRRLTGVALVVVAVAVAAQAGDGSARAGGTSTGAAKLQLTVRAASAATVPGGAAQVIVALSNIAHGNAASADRPELRIAAPQGYVFEGATNLDRVPGFRGHGTPSGSWSCRRSPDAADCSYRGSLAPGGTIALLARFTAPASAKPGRTARFAVSGEGAALGKRSTASLRVVAGPGAPQLYVQATPVLLQAGRQGSEIVDVLNTGPVAADGVQLSNLLPPLVGTWRASGAGWSCSGAASAPPSCSRTGAIAPGKLAPPLRIVFTLAPARVSALKLQPGGRPSIQNWQVSVTTGGHTVQSPAELAVAPSPGSLLRTTAVAARGLQELLPGTSTTLGLRIANLGRDSTDGVALGVQLPDGIDVTRASGGGVWRCSDAQQSAAGRVEVCEPTAPLAIRPGGTLAVALVVQVAADAEPGAERVVLTATSRNQIAAAPPRSASLPLLVLEPNAGFPALTLLRANGKGALEPALDGSAANVISGTAFTERLDVRDAGGAAIAAGATATLRQALAGGARIAAIGAAPGWRCSGTTSLDCAVTFPSALAPAATLPGPLVTITAGAASKTTRNWEATIRLDGPAAAKAYRLPVLVDVTRGTVELVPNFVNVHVPTAGGAGVFALGLRNDGNVATSKPVQLGIHLPAGVRFAKLDADGWSCVTAATSARCASAGALAAGGHLPRLTLHLAFARSTGNRRLSLVARVAGGGRAAMLVEPRHAIRAVIKEPDKVEFDDQPLVRAGEKPKPTILTLEGDGSGGSGLGVSYRWTQRSGAPVTWLGPRTESDVRFRAPQVAKPAVLVFALTVGDGSARAVATARVNVLPLPSAKTGFAIRNAHPKAEKPNGPMREQRKLPKPAARVNAPNRPNPKPDTAATAARTDTTTTPTTTSSGPSPPAVFCQLVNDALRSGGAFTGSVGGVSFDFSSVSVKGGDCSASTTVSFSGSTLALSSLKATGLSGTISSGGISFSAGTLTAPEAWHAPAFSLGGGGLSLPFGSGAASLSGTLTGEGFAFVPLPGGWNGTTTLSFAAGGSGTSVSVSTSATGPKSDASPDSAAPVATIDGSVASDGTFSLAVDVRKIVQLQGSSVDLHGSVKRESPGGPITSSFEGSLASPITIVPGLQIAKLNVKAAPTAQSLGLSGSGQIDLSTPTGTVGVNVDLAYDNPKNWSLTATGTGDASWTPLPGLTIAARDFRGAIVAKGDAYDLTLHVAPSADWKPTSSTTISNLDFTLSNQCPDTGAPCPPKASVFLDLTGDVAFDLPQVGAVKTSLRGSLALPSGELSIEAKLAQPLSLPAGIGITNARVLIQRGMSAPSEDPNTETADAGGYRVDLEGAVSVPGIGQLPTVHASFSGSGWAIAVPLGSFSLPGASGDGSQLGSAVVGWASYATKLDVVDPVTKQVTKIPLQANTFKLTGDFATPGWLKKMLGLSSDVRGRATGTFDPDHDTYALRMAFELPGEQYLYGSAASASNVQLTSTYFEIERAGGDFNVALGGSATMHVAASGSLASSSVDLGLALSYAVTSQTVAGTLSFSSPEGWKNAFGVDDLTLYDLAVAFSFNIPSLTPGVGLGASAVLPSTIRSQLGVTNGARTTLVANISVTNPCLGIEVDDPTNTGKTVLSIGNGALTAKEFELEIAPTGCTVGQFKYAPGVSLAFDGAVAGVSLAIKATIGLSPFGFDGSAELGEFDVGGVTVLQTKVAVTLGTSKLKVTFSGGVQAFGTTVLVSGGLQKNGATVVSDFTGTLDRLSIGNGAVTANGISVTLHTETGAKNVVQFKAAGKVSLLGSTADGAFELSLANGALNKAVADVTAKVLVGGTSGLSLDGKFHLDYSSTSPLEVNATVAAKAGSFDLGTATVAMNGSSLSVTAGFSAGSVFSASLSGAAYYGTPASGTQITLPNGTKVNAKAGDFYVSASNVSLKVAGFSGTGAVFVGRVGGTFYGALNGAIQIVGTSGTNTVNVSGTLSGNGDFSLAGNAALDLAGFKPTVAVSVTKTGSTVAVSGAASIQVLSSSIALRGDFLYDGGQFRFRMSGTGTVVAGGYTLANADVAFSNYPSDAGLRATVALNAGGVASINGTLNINANGGFYLSANAMINLKGLASIKGTVTFRAGPEQQCSVVFERWIVFPGGFKIPWPENRCVTVNVPPTLTAAATIDRIGFSFGASVTIDGNGNYSATVRTPVTGNTVVETPTISFIAVRGYAYIAYHLELTLKSTPNYVGVDGYGSAGIKYQHWDIEWPPWDSGWSDWKDGGSISLSIRTDPSFQACGYLDILGEDIGGCIP